MPLGLLAVGMLLVVVGLKGTEKELAAQLQYDLTGTDANGNHTRAGFIVWLAAILSIGALGYVPVIQKPAQYLLVLILVVMVINNNGVFSSIIGALNDSQTAGPAPGIPNTPAVVSGGQTGATVGNSGAQQQSTSAAGLQSTMQTIGQ